MTVREVKEYRPGSPNANRQLSLMLVVTLTLILCCNIDKLTIRTLLLL